MLVGYLLTRPKLSGVREEKTNTLTRGLLLGVFGKNIPIARVLDQSLMLDNLEFTASVLA
jgi:hypothetical protein